MRTCPEARLRVVSHAHYLPAQSASDCASGSRPAGGDTLPRVRLDLLGAAGPMAHESMTRWVSALMALGAVSIGLVVALALTILLVLLQWSLP